MSIHHIESNFTVPTSDLAQALALIPGLVETAKIAMQDNLASCTPDPLLDEPSPVPFLYGSCYSGATRVSCLQVIVLNRLMRLVTYRDDERKRVFFTLDYMFNTVCGYK